MLSKEIIGLKWLSEKLPGKRLVELLSGVRFSMSIPGIEIYRCVDELGPIRVFEEGSFRFLAFSEDSQQSCTDLSRLPDLVFEYTQAMFLSLLYMPSPKRITLLGLGGGSLIHAFRHYSPDLLIDVVELRTKVIAVAYEWFYVPVDDDRLSIINEDAEVYMADYSGETDIILIDIYNDEGMIDMQLTSSFLTNCFNALSQNGVLVMNLWDQGKGLHPKAKQALKNNFGDHCLACPVVDGNLIVLAFKGGMPQINGRHLQPLVKKLNKRMPFSVSGFVQKLKSL